jgi:probable phosphoglycerate mutase
MNIYLVRHGETEWNHEGRAQGRADTPLNEAGVGQSKALAAYFQGVGLAAVYTSPASRARETASAIAAAQGLTAQTLEGLWEMDLGALDGARLTEMRGQFPDFFRQWSADPATARFPNGETLEETQERAWGAVQTIAQALKPEESAVVVSHAFASYAILCRALGMPLSNYGRLRQDPGGVSLLTPRLRPGHDPAEGPWQVVFLNQTHHLTAHRQTLD